MAKNELTNKERESLQAYLDRLDDLAAQEPPRTMETTTETTITDPDGTTHKAQYDTAWETWHADVTALNNEYHDVIAKALVSSFDDWINENDDDNPPGVAGILRAILAGDSLEIQRQLLEISRYGLLNDNADRALLRTAPETREIDGQYSLVWDVNQAGDNKPAVPVFIALTYEGTDAGVDKRITGEDEAIVMTVSNMIFAQKRGGIPAPWDFTTDQIWREMNGIKDSRKTPTTKQGMRISAALDKMRFTRLRMDLSYEQKKGWLNVDHIRVKDDGKADENYIIASKRHMKTVKGRPVDVYRFYEMPFIYDYNYAKGRIVLVNFDLLDTRDETGNEGDTSVFRLYLLREIALMYRGDRDNTTILYDTLYKETATPTPDERAAEKQHKTENAYKTTVSKEAGKDRKKVAGLLRSWTKDEKNNWIIDFKEIKSGHKFIGVDIILNPENCETAKQKKAASAILKKRNAAAGE